MPPDRSWHDDAACKTLPIEMFFPAAEQEAETAKSICARCTVREPCLEAALAEGEPFGIWGGLTTQERRTVAARRRVRAGAASAAGIEIPLGVR